MFAAVSANDTKRTRELLTAGARVDAVFEGGVRPLHCAVLNDASAMAQTLTEAGTDAVTIDAVERAPLRSSAFSAQLEPPLFNAGASSQLRDSSGKVQVSQGKQEELDGVPSPELMALSQPSMGKETLTIVSRAKNLSTGQSQVCNLCSLVLQE